MKKCINSLIALLVIATLFFSPQFSLPVQASVSEDALSDRVFLTAEEGIYGAALQLVLQNNNSPLVSYREVIGGQAFTAGDLIWIASQQRDFGINPRVLLTTLDILQGLQNVQAGELSVLVNDMAVKMWTYYEEYQTGQRTIRLVNDQVVDFELYVSGATYALAKYLSPKCDKESTLKAYLKQWSESYRKLFNRDPLSAKGIEKTIPVISPFLRLPFEQLPNDFYRVNSFFDHQAPRTFDDYLVRFDGKGFNSASFNNCTLRVSCYGGHNAIDYATPSGTPIHASAAGTVVYRYLNKDPNQGAVDSGLIIDHGNGYRTTYWHQDEIYVKQGDVVAQGQLVGLSGNIGKSSGAHLHYGLRRTEGSKDVDPYGWWSNSADPWGDSFWAWQGDQVADAGESQTQLFYGPYWYREGRGYNNESWWTQGVNEAIKSTNWAIWGMFINTPGPYRVYAYWPKDPDATTSATYHVYQGSIENPVTVNQAEGGDQFFMLGTYNFNKGNAVVILNDLTGDKGKRVYFDAIKWELASSPQPQPAVEPGTYDDTDSNILYSAGWTTHTVSGPANNTLHVSNAIGNSASLTFSGTKASLIYSQNPGYGGMLVDINYVYVSSPANNAATPVFQQRWDSPSLPLGTYTVTFTHDSGAAVDIDAIIISP
jgi:murein DD-endopeptidase MepM/ murein hydrolase activator NlpD